ncbi:aminoglycoside phosphotransferase family protein [Bradyrhizobium sp. CCBAU 51753]|uniref:aminoglycoside phosphotransferase family protein n=1 Tax=Bradyrhizobium sp. CCBAU 51753 TaxID=1325100 RepID=UPI00188D1CF7|nr:aminoglycoside phosphotransferase family protein [Bradyrhizobium sp. CCBAU 51753]QOZ24957.1 aminoglycoside phosphotransferase family protein [Bradyrhizobium sp. CCBAU 51753]
MRGSLGEKLGEGAFADIHAWAPAQVVKLLKAGVSKQSCRWEARMTRAVFAAGCAAPEVLGEVTVEGRFGIVLTRLDGPTLLQQTRSGAISLGEAGAILASLCLAVHNTHPPPDILSLRDLMGGMLRLSDDAVPHRIAAGILALIDRLEPGDGLCHSDVHPGNVIMTADGPRLIDWGSVVRAPAAFELARCHVSLSEMAPEVVDNPARPRAVNAAAQSEYARLTGMSEAALATAIEPYLPIARAFVLFSDAMPALRDKLIQRIETALDPPD